MKRRREHLAKVFRRPIGALGSIAMRYVTFSTTTNPTRRVGVLVPLGNAPGAHTHVVDISAAFEADGVRR